MLACGTRPNPKATITEVGPGPATRRPAAHAGPQLGLDTDGDANRRLAALFVVAITLGLRPGELRKLTWDLVDLTGEWSTSGAARASPGHQDAPVQAVPRPAQARDLRAHDPQAMQDREREPRAGAGRTNLVFCHEDGSMYFVDAPSTGASAR